MSSGVEMSSEMMREVTFERFAGIPQREVRMEGTQSRLTAKASRYVRDLLSANTLNSNLPSALHVDSSQSLRASRHSVLPNTSCTYYG